MSKDILGAADAILQRNATQPEAFGADGELQKGLRSGTLGMGSQLASLGGAVAGELGADGASRGLYDKSTELRMRAAETAPRVQSIDQVGSLRDGMDFVAGTVGQALPSVVPAIAAGVATRNAGLTTRMLAPAATFAPMEMGDVVQRQQDAGQEVNLRDAALIGGGSAALQSVVPGVVGAKLAGRAAAPLVAGGGLRATTAKNIAGAALGESATEAGGEAFKQAAMGQDLDATAIRDNAIAGALGGAALGAPGAAGDVAARGGAAARAAVQGMSEKVKAAPGALKTAAAGLSDQAVSSARRGAENAATGVSEAMTAGKTALDETDLAGVAQNVKNVGADAGQTVLDALAGLKSKAASAAERMTQGKPLEDDPMLAEGDPASPEFQARVQEMDKGHTTKAKEFADGLLAKADGWLTPERRSQLTEAASNLGDAANRATVAGMQKAREGYDRASTMLRSATDDMRAWAEARLPAADKNAKQSKVMSGLGAQIDESVVSRALNNHGVEVDPEVRTAFSSALANTVRAMTIGERVPARTVSMLDDALGEQSSAVMEQVFRATFPGATLQQRDAFYKGLNKVLDTRDSYTRVIDRMTNALQPEQAKSVTTSDMRALYRAVREWDARPDRGTAEDRYRSRQIVEGMREYFGEKTDSVLEDIRKSRLKEEQRVDTVSDEDGADFDDGLTETDVEDPDPKDPALAFERQSPEQSKADPSAPLSAVGVSRMRFKGGKGADDRRTSKSAVRTHPEKPDTDVFDAIKMTEAMHKALPRAGMDEKSNLHRTARMFSEATARLQEKLGRTFEVPDDTVISKNGITWGKAKAALEPEQLVPDAAIHDARERMLSAKSAEGRMFWADVLKEREDRKARMQLEQENETTDDIKSELVDLRDAYTQTLYERNGAKDSKRIESLNKTLKFLAEQGKALEAKYGKANLGDERFTYGDDAQGGVDLTKARYADDERTPQADRAAARHMAQEARTSRADMERENPGDMGSGATEVDPMGQIHQAMAAHGKRNFDEKGKFNNEIPDEEDGFKRAWHSAGRSREGMLGRLSSKISQMESATYSRENKTYVNKPAQALGTKARELFGKFDQLKPTDQAALLSIVQADKPSDAAGTINELTAKYANKPAKDMNARVDAIAAKEAWDVLDTPEKATKFIEAAAPRMRELSELDDLTDAQRQAYAGLFGVLGRNADPHMLVTEADGFYELSKQEQDALLARVDAATAAPEVAARSPKAQAARLEARARSGDASLVKEINAMQDAKSLQRALDHLNAVGIRGEATDALNARIGELAQDPDVAYNLQAPAGSAVPHATRMDVQRHIEKVLGPKINVAWKVMGHEGEYTAHDDTIRVAVHSMNPMGTAFHESFHAWVKRLGDHGAQDIANTIMRAASSDHVIAQLRDRLKGEPAALEQLKDAEERAAYMYQFWAADPQGFRVPAAARGVLDKIGEFFRKVLGIVSNDERALHIMEAFHAGDFARAEQGRGRAIRTDDAILSTALGRMYAEHVESWVDRYDPSLALHITESSAKGEYVGVLQTDGHGKQTIGLNMKALKNMPPDALAAVAAHEFGHALWTRMERVLPAASIQSIRADHASLVKKVSAPGYTLHDFLNDWASPVEADAFHGIDEPISTFFANDPRWKDYVLSFDEFAAEQIARALTSDSTHWHNPSLKKIMTLHSSGLISGGKPSAGIAAALQKMESMRSAQSGSKTHALLQDLSAFGRNAALEKIKAFVKPLTDLGERLVGAGSENLRDTGIPALRDLANAMKLKQTISGDAADAGFIPESRRMRTEFLNQLSAGLKGMSPENMDAALQELQGGAKATDVKARVAVKVTRKVLADMLQYMQDAGVRVEALGMGVDYFPRVYDVNYIGSNRDAFRAVLTKHGVANPDRIVSNLITAQGNEFTIESMKPGMQFAKERVLKNIPDSELAPFMVKDYSRIMASYINQATRRAEWARRFGDDGARVTELLAKAKEQGADAGQLRHAAEFVQGVDGTLGDGLDPRARKLMGNLIVYQNIRLLPLAIFSSVVDPLGIAVRGGTVGDAFAAFKRGVKEIPNSFRDDAKITNDLAADLAETLGTVESATLNHVVGEMYTESMTSDWARKVNDKFFKYNMMEGWNRSMRVAATQAAIKFIARHADGTADAHSKRWIAELGLEPGSVPMRNGELDVADPRVKSAVHRWVDGAVLRPDAADKPVWMNDPHFALISHLKQFVYAFNETILKRVVHEAKFGNYDAALALASYVPVMIAADAAKGLIMGGGEEPEWKKGWTFGDYLGNGVQRAGLFGVGQFGLDVQERGLGALTGPTIEQLSDAVGVMGGREAFGKFALDAMPAHALFGAAFDGAEPAPSK